ncbi:PD-(D/E)XK nuclease family protein [Ensifer sp. ENS04]|uniref:PD-(D/E)XK nuclease family protein n=1 Tax=Ensifer sp. ENS04 TaxID=2769281 RepID=UPI0017833B9E|nr:PD-(D/E)XK nuclease family protein [Ensifer sp. ENS04]MBD9541426.1 PD-(D/E)XK nuclease family protein [Ensifer sp. ENS04]
MRLSPLETRSPTTGAERPVTPDLLASTFLAPRAAAYELTDVLQNFEAPWSDSYAVAPDEVSQHIAAALRQLALATPGLSVQAIDLSNLPNGRARHHLAALKSLWERMEDALPEDLHIARHVLACSSDDALEPLPIVGGPCPFESRAEAALREHLAALFGTVPESTNATLANGALGHVQRHLLDTSPPVSSDDALHVFGLRDPREEISFAAARAQALNRRGFRAQDIGLLVPDDPAYQLAIEPAFNRVGLQLSGMTAPLSLRDHVGEFLTNLLAVLRGPAPRMALASLCLSPLAQWPAVAGRNFANEYIENGWSRAARAYTGPGAKIFDELRPVSSPGQLIARLCSIANELVDPSQLMPRINALRPLLKDEYIDWSSLARVAAPGALRPDGEGRFVEGVSVFSETALPWRSVRHLIVAGAAGTYWPRPVTANPFFTESEIVMIEGATNLRLPSRRQTLARRLELFRRQLGAATDGITLTASTRDLEGKQLAPTTGLSLIARALGAKDAEALITDAVGQFQSSQAQGGAVTSDAHWDEENTRPVLPEGSEIDIPGDPFALRKAADGAAKSQSPSRLETLLVSPLGWLLGEIGAEDRTWVPESLDVLTLGKLVHSTLETLFPEGASGLDETAIRVGFPAAFETAITQSAPWLVGDNWVSERTNLAREALEAALNWGRFLIDNGARVRRVETLLSGAYHHLSINGRADCLLDLADNRVMVVDHKRSSSSSRRRRMEAAADLQVELYRRMIPTTPEFAEVTPGRIVTAYHCTLDGRVVTGPEGKGLKGVVAVNGQIGSTADEIVSKRIKALSKGRLALNLASDSQNFEKVLGIKPYALDNPLVAAFLLPDASPEDALV